MRPSNPMTSRRLRLTLLAAVAAGILSHAAPAVAAPAPAVSTTAGAAGVVQTAAGDATRWTVTPADEDGPDDRISLRHVIDPGAQVDDHVAVTNLGAAPATFTVAAGDGRLGANGAFDIAAGEPERAGSWIQIHGLEEGTLTLDGGETRVLPVSISVPANATPGDAPAGIVVALSQSQDAVTVTNRIGVRLHLRVAGDVAPLLEISGVETSFTPSWIPFAPGTLRVDYDVTNAGNVRLGAAGAATAGGPFGWGSHRGGATIDELLPGDRMRASTEVAAWPWGMLWGDLAVSGTVVGADDVAAPDAVVVGFVQPAPSWTGLAVLGIGAAVVVILIRRRRARAEAASADGGTESSPTTDPAAVREPVAGGVA